MKIDLTTPPTEAEIAQAIDGRGGAISGIIRRLAFQRDMLLSRVEASQLVWTDAKPTVPGLWLYRLYPNSVPLQWCVSNVVEVNGQLVHDVSDGEYEPIRDDGQFAGPIPPPADAITSAAPSPAAAG